MSRLDAKWLDFTQRGQVWDHFWQDGPSPVTIQAFSQAQVAITTTSTQYAQSICYIKVVGVSNVAQSQLNIRATSQGYAQAQTYINVPDGGGAFQSNAFQNNAFQVDAGDEPSHGFAQAQADIKQTYFGFAQAQGTIGSIKRAYAQAMATIKATESRFAQAQSDTKATLRGYGQAQCYVRPKTAHAQAQCKIDACVILYDSFSRIVSGSIDPGSPDEGPDYDFVGDPQTEFSFSEIDGSVVTTPDGFINLYTSDTNYHDVTGSIDFIPNLAEIANYVKMTFKWNIALPPEVTLYTPISTSLFRLEIISDAIFIEEDLAIDSGEWYTLKVQVSGPTLRVKLWKRADAEPDWQYEEDDPTLNVPDTAFRVLGQPGYTDFDPLTQGGPIVWDNWLVTQPCPITAGYGQAQALILQPSPRKYAQAQALISQPSPRQYGQAQADILSSYRLVHAQAQAEISISYVVKHAQANAYILNGHKHAQAQTRIITFGVSSVAQAQTDIKYITPRFAQAQTLIALKASKFAQAKAHIHRINYSHGLAQVHITNVTSRGYGQANALITSTHKQVYGQAQAQIRRSIAFAQAQAMINAHFKMAQGQALIRRSFLRYGQAQAYIKAVSNDEVFYGGFAQAQVLLISGSKYAQAQARIRRSDGRGHAQAQASIKRSIGFAQAQTFITGGRYLIRYNQHLLPGYAQTESFTSGIRIDDHYAPYFDSSLSEYMGLENKTIPITMRVAETTYLESKEQVQLAGTMIRSTRSWAKLYVQRSDRHYEALSSSVKMQQNAESRFIDYTVEFNAKPWLISDAVYTVSGTNLITITRTLDDGGWTPATVHVSGTDVTISGYSTTESCTGFISLSGAINNMVITTQPFTATVNGVNSLPHVNNTDYELYVGPGTTYISVDGATDCVITYNNRWYL